MKAIKGHVFEHIVRAYPCRPLGGAANAGLLDYLEDAFRAAGLDVLALPFECRFWSAGRSSLEAGGISHPILASPFSPPFSGTGRILKIRTAEELAASEIGGRVLLLHDAIATEGLMPKEFPFYYPDEHRQIIDALESRAPAAVIAITGKSPMSGLDPFPLFEDGNFSIPTGYTGGRAILAACQDGDPAKVTIASSLEARPSRQVIGRRVGLGPERIIVCAHMDTKYDTPGAIDNTAGVAVLLELAGRIAELRAGPTIDLVPFNGEENYAVPGQLKYLELLREEAADVRLAINLDAPGYSGAQNAFSLYNFSDAQRTAATAIIEGSTGAAMGAEWYAGDHSMFVYAGTPAIAVGSLDPDERISLLIHTEKDMPESVDPRLLSCACETIIRLINGLRM